MRRIFIGGLVVLVAAALFGASATVDTSGTATPEPAATYDLPPRPVRFKETPLHVPAVRDGDMSFQLIGLRANQPYSTGSHAEFLPKRGQFVQIRLIVQNHSRSTHTIDVYQQLLVTADDQRHKPDLNAMTIRRQPQKIDVGAEVRIEFDLWYDVAKDLGVRAMRLHGDTVIGDSNAAGGVEVKLT